VSSSSKTHLARHGELAAADRLEVDRLAVVRQPGALALAFALDADRVERAASEAADEVAEA